MLSKPSNLRFSLSHTARMNFVLAVSGVHGTRAAWGRENPQARNQRNQAESGLPRLALGVAR